MRFTNTERSKQFLLEYDGSFVEIKKIILIPKFDWATPDEWVAKLISEELYIQISSTNSKGVLVTQPYVLASFNNPYLFQPVFTLSQPINIPKDLWTNRIYMNDYPLQVKVELLGSAEQFSFDVMVVYDEAQK